MDGKRIALAAALAFCLTLAGCSWPGGSYVSVTAHQEQRQTTQNAVISAASYAELRQALEEIVAAGTETATIQVADYPSDTLEKGVAQACRYIRQDYALGAYAVKEISCEVGTSVGVPALAVSVEYQHSRSELLRIHTVSDADEACKVVQDALADFDASVVLLCPRSVELDFTQVTQDYARDNPQIVMEIPQVTQTDYGTGDERVVELIFSYQTDRDSLRRMQTQVEPVFDSAVLYVSGDDADQQKFAQLYAFLMERFDYKLETSITPTYSLLRHGVGDSRAFATVYAAMCRAAGLECQVVSGTHSGEPWTWNIVLDDGYYYHVDLLRCSELGGFRELTDSGMGDYVWDYSSYPECTGAPAQSEESADSAQETAEETAPETEETLPQEVPAVADDEASPA